jgi:effector protein LidA
MTTPLSPHTDTLLSYPSEEPVKELDSKQAFGNEQQAITLKARDGKMVELTASHLEQWFASIEKNTKGNEASSAGNEQLTSQLLSRYGLRTSMDVIKFFHTPAGETVKKMMEERLAEIIAIEEWQHQQMLDDQTRHHRMLAFLLLGMAHKKHAHAKHLNEAIQQQIDAQLHQAKKDQSSHKKEADGFARQLEAYDASIKAMESTLADKQNDLTSFTRELLSIAELGRAIDLRYKTFAKSLDELDAFENSSIHPTDLEKTTANILSKIQGLEVTLESQLDEIEQLIVNDKDDEAKALGVEHQGLHLQIGGLKDMLDVINNKKFLYDANGESTLSFKKAAFILKPDLKVVKDANGMHYLIGAHEKLEDLNDNDKALANKRFNKLQPEISNVKNLAQHNHKLESDFHGDRMKSAEKRGVTPQAVTKLYKEITLLKNQLSQVQAARANVIAEMSKPAPDANKAMGMQASTPSLSSSTTTIKKAPVYTVETFRAAIQQILSNPSRQNIQNAITNVTNVYGENGAKIKAELGKITPGQHLPRETRLFLERNIQRLVSPTDNPRHSPTEEPEPIKNTSSFSPFSTTPFKK